MNITVRAFIVLQQIDAALEMAEKVTPAPWRNNDTGAANVLHFPDQPKTDRPEFDGVFYLHTTNRHNDATFIATSRTLLPASLRCLKTAIEGLLEDVIPYSWKAELLTTLCDQWEAGR